MYNISPFFGQLMSMIRYVSDPVDPGSSGDPDAAATEDPAVNTDTTHTETVAPEQSPSFSWKAKVGADLSKAPSLGKFEDTPEGLAEVAKSYVNLEKLLGHEKVPLPKGPEDLEGIANFNKALGVPETAEGYNLPDVNLPGEMGKMGFDKETFGKVVHKYGLTPKQAEGLWKDYTAMSGDVYNNHRREFENNLNSNINKLRAEWGDAYAANVELGDMVISKFADDQAMGDFLTASLSKDPAGMKFLAKIGEQFSENKIGEFRYKRFALTPDEAKAEIDRIKMDPNHAYNSEKAPESDHQQAVEHVNRLIAISIGKKV